jgi:MoaA/NifB/PqqE/SkfB family radical SAM enzyme
MSNYAYLQVTRECNQDCLFCSNPSNDHCLNLDNAKKIINRFIDDGCNGVILTGGEPTTSSNLFEIIDYAKRKKLDVKIITNGQMLSDDKLLDKVIECGVSTFHVSVYSVKSEIQGFLSKKSDSLENIMKTFRNMAKHRDILVTVNTVINKLNQDHLSHNVDYLVKNFPFIRHFVWNNIDAQNLNSQTREEVVAKLNGFYLELKKATDLLKKNARTFRVERVPLCYMPGFEYASTETRKIVKNEDRKIFFLDNERKYFNDTEWYYDKFEACKKCFLNKICAGLYMGKKGYNDKNELFPVFVSEEGVKNKIKMNER